MASVDVALMKFSEALENLRLIGDVLVKKKRKKKPWLLPAGERKNLPLMPEIDTPTIQSIQQRENIQHVSHIHQRCRRFFCKSNNLSKYFSRSQLESNGDRRRIQEAIQRTTKGGTRRFLFRTHLKRKRLQRCILWCSSKCSVCSFTGSEELQRKWD